jgi:hypothetical protein
VAIGVSGAAQMGHSPVAHCQMPLVQVIVSVQSGPQDAPGVLHAVPDCGITAGHPVAGAAQCHSGGLMGWQMGYSEPPLQPLHAQRVPSPYQQESVESEQVLLSLGGGVGHAAGSGGAVQDGVVTCQALALHTAVVRHWGRTSSP